jgi:dihydrofolate synthase / folylpolyglutamate synthase
LNYEQTLDYLFARLPMYQRIGPAAYKANLDNIIALCQYLGNPQQAFKSIHIAGTNGKGSVAHMLASVFASCGYKTGLATSPHLVDFRERIRMNGAKVPEQFVTDFVAKHKTFFEPLNASFFEICIAMTFQYFAEEQVDMAIIETGLGGRLDSTNIITPELSVITNIGFDHMHLLGDSLPAIATEKAGIIKAGIPVVIGRKQDDIHDVFVSVCLQRNAPLFLAEDMIKLHAYSHETLDGKSYAKFVVSIHGLESSYHCDLTGNYQRENLRTVLAALMVYEDKHGIKLPEDKIRQGLLNVSQGSGLAGRWQQLAKRPLTICDTAHNVDGMACVVDQLLAMPHENLHIVFGMVDDKDAMPVLRLLPGKARYYFCRPDVPRGMDANKLAKLATEAGLTGTAHASVTEALDTARSQAAFKDLIFVGGSTFVVAEVVNP